MWAGLGISRNRWRRNGWTIYLFEHDNCTVAWASLGDCTAGFTPRDLLRVLEQAHRPSASSIAQPCCKEASKAWIQEFCDLVPVDWPTTRSASMSS